MNTNRRLLAATIAALALLTAAGCGGGDDDSASSGDQQSATTTTDASASSNTTTDEVEGASSDDPCRMLTAEEAEAALGRAVREPVTRIIPESPQTGAGFDCAYSSATEESGPASVHVALLGDRVPRDAWEQAERSEGLEEISGVGELAFFDSSQDELMVFDAGRWVQVQMINSTRPAELVALLSTIATNALERI
jgi:hypothetical protein